MLVCEFTNLDFKSFDRDTGRSKNPEFEVDTRSITKIDSDISTFISQETATRFFEKGRCKIQQCLFGFHRGYIHVWSTTSALLFVTFLLSYSKSKKKHGFNNFHHHYAQPRECCFRGVPRISGATW